MLASLEPTFLRGVTSFIASVFVYMAHVPKTFSPSPVITVEQRSQLSCQRKVFHPPSLQRTIYFWFLVIHSLLLHMYLFLGPFRGHTEEPIFCCGVVFYFCDHYRDQVWPVHGGSFFKASITHLLSRKLSSFDPTQVMMGHVHSLFSCPLLWCCPWKKV